jgi:hypothetical protein
MEGDWHLLLVTIADRISYNIQGSDDLLPQACFKVTAGSALYQLCAGPSVSPDQEHYSLSALHCHGPYNKSFETRSKTAVVIVPLVPVCHLFGT